LHNNETIAGACEDGVEHVLFQGGDTDHEGMPYETSIPASTAFDRRRDVLLAYEMNGRDLPTDHGYPLRVVVPGTVGARQVKWLRRIVLSRDESQSFWQQKDYKMLNPSTSWDMADLSQVMSINAAYRVIFMMQCSGGYQVRGFWDGSHPVGSGAKPR